MTIQFYVDESGPNEGPALVMAGLYTSALRWAEFSTEWDAVLHESPKVDYFKMREADRRIEQFKGFSRSQRDAKLRRLAEIMSRYAFRSLYVTLGVLEPIAEYPRPKGAKNWALNEPYFWVFHYYIQMAATEIASLGVTERFEIIFDQHKHGDKARAFYPLLRLLLPSPIKAVAPLDPIFRDDHDTLPLQAADMVAWLTRRAVSGEPHEYGWLDEVFAGLKNSRFSIQLKGGLHNAEIQEDITDVIEPEDIEEFRAEFNRLMARHGIDERV